ncbi:hypothetical protein [Methylophaga pinxianii]|uniref:hypothetical protein n=1 Tax=Methylophaga pinxianii TaxID=2881052 RepID=UPI001CF173C4|nr:hypothetical protein [Methylophaga pinxianii]MCB2427654.1 hypothetical protein [Methylophaga pinxianii]UPH46643.1 hypothetical protein LGT42_004995 [Methylophaga pinxianii]
METLSANNSSVSWAAIFAGAVSAAAMTLLMLILGFGLGFSVISPWQNEGVSMETIGWSTIIWLTVTQLVAAGLGGYIAGRLRTRWTDINIDEVYFRDTAHGLISWAVATLLVALLILSSVGAVISGTAKAGASVAQGATSAVPTLSEAVSESSDYFTDALLRTEPGAEIAQRADGNVRDELSNILVQALRDGELNENDKQYVVGLVANYTELDQAGAEQRVNEVIESAQQAATDAEQTAREAADTALEGATFASLWIFIALLIGAYIASFMATVGGRQRDSIVQ